jgi:hypothetical protein
MAGEIDEIKAFLGLQTDSSFDKILGFIQHVGSQNLDGYVAFKSTTSALEVAMVSNVAKAAVEAGLKVCTEVSMARWKYLGKSTKGGKRSVDLACFTDGEAVAAIEVEQKGTIAMKEDIEKLKDIEVPYKILIVHPLYTRWKGGEPAEEWKLWEEWGWKIAKALVIKESSKDERATWICLRVLTEDTSINDKLCKREWKGVSFLICRKDRIVGKASELEIELGTPPRVLKNRDIDQQEANKILEEAQQKIEFSNRRLV